MAWAYGTVGALATEDDATSGAGGITPALPASLASGDIMFAHLAGRANVGAVWDGLTGWTELGSSADNTLKLMAKIAGGSESAPTFTTATAHPCAARIARFTGGPASLTSIVANSALYATGGTAYEDLATPALTVPQDNSLIMYVGAAWNDTWVAGTQPNGSTEIANDNFNTTADLWLAWSYAIQTAKADIAVSKWDTTDTTPIRSNSIVLSLLPLITGGSVPVLQNYRSLLVR